MSKCEKCGARMRFVSIDAIMCERLYELVVARYHARDDRYVTHESLTDEPLVIYKVGAEVVRPRT